MSFQAAPYSQFLGFGVIGEIYDAGPTRAFAYTLNSASAANNVFGRAFTVVSQGIAAAGGTGVFAGFLVNPKESALYGATGSSPLTPTLALPNFSVGTLLTMGSIIVTLPAAAAIGDYVYYNTTTGVLTTQAPLAVPLAGTKFAYATVARYALSAAGLAVITISDFPTAV